MIHLLTKGQKIVFLAGICVIFVGMYYVSLPQEVQQWTPENFRIEKGISGTDYGPSFSLPEVGSLIEKNTGIGYQSLEVFQKKGYDKNKVIIIRALADGKSMFISEKENLFTLQDMAPNMITSLAPKSIEEKNGKVVIRYEVGGNVFFIFGILALVWGQ